MTYLISLLFFLFLERTRTHTIIITSTARMTPTLMDKPITAELLDASNRTYRMIVMNQDKIHYNFNVWTLILVLDYSYYKSYIYY